MNKIEGKGRAFQGEKAMRAAAVAFLSFLTGSPVVMAAPLKPDFGSKDIEFANLTLRVDGADLSVEILDQHNLNIRLIPPEYQGTQGSKAFAIECAFEPIYRVSSVDTRLDGNIHLIPADILEYSNEFPSTIKLQFDTLFFKNKINDPDPGNHTLFIRFFTNGG